MKTLKRIAAIVATLALTVGMCSNCFAAETWGHYFGMEEGAGHGLWYEGAAGTMKSQTEDSWEADFTSIGWGGVWGAQVFQEAGKVTIKKGETYQIKCTLKSSNCDKWVLIKIATDDNYAYGKWLHLKKGEAQTLDEEFTAKCDANSIYFGLGGEFGDRTGSDADAEIRYAFAPGGAEAIDDVDATYATKISCTGFYLGAPGGEDVVETPETDTDSTPSTVNTGDFMPIACGAAAVLAAATIVVFARKRRED